MTKNISFFIFQLALLFFLLNAAAAAASQLNIPGPTGSGSFGAIVKTLPNGNVVVIDPLYDITSPSTIRDVGAVYLYSGRSGALISTLTGSKVNDKIGQNGITILENGDYLIHSPGWDNGNVQDAGAITYGNAVTGVSGVVSLANSLSSNSSDAVGNTPIKKLSNGRVLMFNPSWSGSRGAVTFFQGTNFPVGLISAANSLIGTNTSDRVGTGVNGTIDTTELPNGNYVVVSSSWNTNRGAVTLCSGATGCIGAVTAVNSLVGTTSSDSVGVGGISVLSNGNYVVKSRNWYNGSVRNAGAVTFCNGNTGLVGEVSSSNSLVGSFQNDFVGIVTVLTNGNYVVHTSSWNAYRGSATFGSGVTGVSGIISSANSLVGTIENDQVSDNGVTPLNNGNFVVSTTNWASSRGAVTWASGLTGIAGEISPTNSFVGASPQTHVGMYTQTRDVFPLPNGNYVIRSLWGTRGAITVADGASGLVGFITEANSLFGEGIDQIGSGGIEVLPSGHFAVYSPYWDNGNIYNAGALTICNPNGVIGEVSAANSLVGSHAEDNIGGSAIYVLSNDKIAIRSNDWNSDRGAVTFISDLSTAFGEISENNSIVGINSNDLTYASVKPLRSGNCLIFSSNWNNGRGAVRFIPGCGNAVGTLSETNSLVGSQNIGYISELPNGNLILTNPAWNDYRGSVTFINQFTGMPVGLVSESNSLVGTTANDMLGFVSGGLDGITILPNSNIIVRSPRFDNGSTIDAGALTLVSGSTPTSGTISAANSLIGSSANDQVGSNLTVFQDGSFASQTFQWDNGNVLNAGAVTFGNSTKSPTGYITSENSVLGTTANGGGSLRYDYSSAARKLIVGRPGSNLVTFFHTQNSEPIFDFDGDSKTDIGIYRASDGSWWLSRSSDNTFRSFSFGASNDLIAPGDYTGDGKTDVAIFRPSTGEWFIQRSEDNSFFSFPFGTNGDIPVPADYDSDGKADAAVFRPSSGTWFISNSNGSGTSIVNFGSAEDKPVPSDYDGDGKADIAIFRPSDGSWWYLRSLDAQFRVFRFGVGTDKPVPGDYSGDGKADIAVFRESTGEWFFQRSEDNSYYSLPFGAAGDIPTPGDYDSDGKFDTAVFRPSTSNWFVQRSSAGILITSFGAAGDRPIPGAFVP